MTGSGTQAITTVLHPVSDPATAKALCAGLLGRRVATVTDPDGNVVGLLQDR